ncbi:MAG: tetratricopeptide repeat protein [Planctomycetota bacterium]|nr:tetratricopeptide repeat protein [Planctomycetota bacterium]
MKDSPNRCGPAPQEAGQKKPIARSKITRWRIGVLIGVHVLFALHLAHWKATGKTMTPLEPSEAMEFSKRSVINAGFIFFALMILSTLIFGRFFCGWACHLVFVQDLCASLMKRLGITPRPLRSRSLALVPFLAAFYLFIWPFIERTWLGVLHTNSTLQLETSKFWATFPGLMIGILTFVFAGGVVVYLLGSKGFCTYGCPYGAFFSIADRVAPARIRVNDDCGSCGHCTVSCTSNVAVAFEVKKYGMVVDPDCLKTLDCVSVCPNDALSVGFGKPSIAVSGKQKRRPRFTFGYELLITLGFSAAFFTFRGLYGRIPFLMALAVGSTLAFLLLRGVQLFTQPRVSIAPFDLKLNGRLTRAGKGFAVFGFALMLFCGHSAWIRTMDFMSKRAYAPLIPVRTEWFTAARPELTPEIKAAANLVIERSTRVLDAGFFETPRCRVERAWASMILGDTQTFSTDMAVAASLAPDDVNTVVEPAHNLRAQGLVAESLPLYLEGARRDLDEVQTMKFLLDAAGQAGQIQVAIDHLEEQVAKRSWDSDAFEHLAIGQMMARRPVEALESFEKALAKAPEASRQQRLTVQVARLHMEAGRPTMAEEVLQAGRIRLPEDTHIIYVLAQVLYTNEKIDAAIDILDQGLLIEPQNETLQSLRKQIGTHAGRQPSFK